MRALAACMAVLGWGSASAYTLDFGNGPNPPTLCSAVSDGSGAFAACSSGSYFNQNHGDVPGVVDVSYANLNSPGQTLLWWPNNYNNLYGVLYAGGSDAASAGRISLVPAPGQGVTLQDFQLGAYSQTTRNTNVSVYAIGNPVPVWSFSGAVGNGSVAANQFLVGLSSSTGFHIDWSNSAFNVGIDNVNFTVAAIPEPGTWALMAGGLMAVAGWARRRR